MTFKAHIKQIVNENRFLIDQLNDTNDKVNFVLTIIVNQIPPPIFDYMLEIDKKFTTYIRDEIFDILEN